MYNAFIFHEIISEDPAELQLFYQSLFGWSFQPVDDNGDLIAIGNEFGGNAPAGLLTRQKAEAGFHKSTLFYIQVEDLELGCLRVEQLGGKVLMAPTVSYIGHYQYKLAVVADQEGNHLGLMEPVLYRGVPIAVNASQFSFNEIISEDPTELVWEFYQPLFQWQIVKTGEQQAPFFQVNTGQSAIPQGGIGKTSREPGFNKFSSFYIQVDQVQHTLEQITALGGKTLMERVCMPLGDTQVEIAMFLDPQDNQLGLINFNPDQKSE